MSEHGHCPHCGLNFDGGNIIDTFIKMGRTKEEAEEVASHYGYGPGRTQWDKRLNVILYDEQYNKTKYWECPECKQKV